MFWAFLTLLMLVGGIGALIWFCLRRLGAHLKNNPQAAKLLAEHILTSLIFGGEEPGGEDKP